ncbi:MAG: beta-lactamase family protein [Chitinophagaceae bacterium]|nr:beta-lactamase family protein [Chitinophagaceae bacterium]
MKIAILILFILVLVSSCHSGRDNSKGGLSDPANYHAPAPGKMSDSDFQQYHSAISSLMDSCLLRGNFNGGILVAKNGEIIYEKYQGWKDIQHPTDSLDEHSPLHLASTSKPFMSIAILSLVQENKLSLNDSINKFFPEIPFPGITVAMLLSHRSGLPNYLYYMDHSDWDRKITATNADVLRILCRDKPEGGSPANKHFSYSNTNFVLLAMIVEKISGISYPEFMKQHFFDPIEMKDTYVVSGKDSLKATPSFTATGRRWDHDYLDGTYGDKNIYSTPRDLLKFDQALYSGQFIRPSLLDSAFIPQSNERKSVHNYGLGWRLQQLPNGKKVVYHFGKWHGCNAAFARLMDEKVTIIILGNRYTRTVYNAAHHCYGVFGAYDQKQEPDPEEGNEKQRQTP